MPRLKRDCIEIPVMSKLEMDTLAILSEKLGEVVSYKELSERVWGYYSPDGLKSLICKMRRKLPEGLTISNKKQSYIFGREGGYILS